MSANDYGILFPTSVVGSMPRPDFVKDLVSGETTVAGSEYKQRMEAAVRYVIALQEHAGLDIVTDGEWWRKSYIGVIAELAHGFELGVNPKDGRPWTIVVDKLSPKNSGYIAQEISFLKSCCHSMIKATLPAPALLGERMWSAEQSSSAYPSRDDFVRDCVPILRQEMLGLREEGVTIIQIDDPHLCLFVDPEVRNQYDDPDRAADFAVEMVNEMIDGIDGVKFALHLCRRAGARVRGEIKHSGGYEPILHQLNRLSVHHLTMEFTTPAAGDVAIFKDLRDDFEIGLGCVSCEPGNISTTEDIVNRVDQACEYIDPSRITLNPDCGFAPGSAANVSLDEVYIKLKNEAEAATRLRQHYS